MESRNYNMKVEVNHCTLNIYYKSHHLSAYGAVNSTEPCAIPPVGYNARSYAEKRVTLNNLEAQIILLKITLGLLHII